MFLSCHLKECLWFSFTGTRGGTAGLFLLAVKQVHRHLPGHNFLLVRLLQETLNYSKLLKHKQKTTEHRPRGLIHQVSRESKTGCPAEWLQGTTHPSATQFSHQLSRESTQQFRRPPTRFNLGKFTHSESGTSLIPTTVK